MMMKRTWFVVLLLFLAAVAANTAERTVLMESFTNTGCGPCYNANLAQESVVQDLGRTIAVIVRYHWYYQPGDPFYEYNISENMARFRFYHVPYIPWLKADGILWVNPSSETSIRNAISQRREIESPCTINVSTATIGLNVEATVQVTAEENMHDPDTRLFVTLIHKCHQWDDVYWWYPFRDMKPGTLGVSFQLDADSTFEFIADFSTDPGWNLNNLSVVAFVQLYKTYTTSEVLQASFADVAELAPTLFINEFMTDNTSTVQDPQGEYEDWVEIYNPGPDAVNLDGLSLTDDLTKPDKWNFPDTLLSADDCLIIWCDSDLVDPGLHANFSLASAGEHAGLFMDLTTCYAMVDSIHFGSQSTDISYGRTCDGGSEWDYFTDPTPGASNIDSVRNLTIYLDGSGVRLFWQTNDCAASYTIYRHDTFPFNPNPSDSIGFTSETTYLDAEILLSDTVAFYRVTARP